MSDTVRFYYSSWHNISFHGELDSGIPKEEWTEMDGATKKEIMNEAVHELVDLCVIDEED